MNTHLEYQDDKSHKFWKIALEGKTFTTTYGKVGSNGQSSTKTFNSEEKVQKEAEKLVAHKLKKG